MTHAVPEPVGRCGNAHTTGSNRKREDLSNDNPSARAPGGGEEGDVEANKGNHGRDGRVVVFLGSTGCDAYDRDDELHYNHPRASDDEDLAAAEAFDGPEGYGGRTDVDKGGDEGDEERVADRAEGFEEDSSEIEDEVDSGQLLHHLHENT